MICPCCKDEKPDSYFIDGRCYQCLYKIKLSNKSKEKASNRCRICNNEIIFNENEKKRQRTVFCSSKCAKVGHKNQLDNHWTRRLIVND